MRKEIIYENRSLYRDAFRIQAYIFGTGRRSVCIAGSMRGNEYQQLYTCSQIIQALKRLEKEGRLLDGHEIMVIPSLNPYSMNIEKRFWPIDNTDINRMFPGYSEGETTQRIAGAVFEKIKDCAFGIQFASNYMPGEFMPHVTMMKTGFEDVKGAMEFCMPYDPMIRQHLTITGRSGRQKRTVCILRRQTASIGKAPKEGSIRCCIFWNPSDVSDTAGVRAICQRWSMTRR